MLFSLSHEQLNHGFGKYNITGLNPGTARAPSPKTALNHINT